VDSQFANRRWNVPALAANFSQTIKIQTINTMKKSNSQSRPILPQSVQRLFLSATLFLALPLFGADAALSPLAKTMDYELKILEHDLVPLAEAMPAARYDFAPTNGEFKGVRTFGEQVKHVAGGIYGASATVLGEKPPVDLGPGGGGAADLKTKEEIVKFLKGAFAYAHRAMATLTEANSGEEVDAGWGKHSRLFMADVILWHSYDHYGQMVVYVRMNGIVPPASRPRK